MPINQELMERMSHLTDAELHEIVTSNRSEYTEEALQAAEALLHQRGYSDSEASAVSTGEMGDPTELSTFGDLLKIADLGKISDKLFNTLKEDESLKEQYTEVFMKLKTLRPVEAEEAYVFLAQITENFAIYPFDVFGIEPGASEHFSLEVVPWAEWLTLKIHDRTKSFIAKVGVEEFIAVCLRKMTTFGFTEEEIEATFADSASEDFWMEGSDEV